MKFGKTRAYARNVFINCPFDPEFDPIFEAIVFTVFACGFRPVCARQRLNSAEVRLEKILSLIGDSRLSIHDLSRTQPDADTGNPRFNMPFELGLDLGCRSFHSRYADKHALIFGEKKYEYQKFFSDIAGQDVHDHQNGVAKAIAGVRNFLAAQNPDNPVSGPARILKRYEEFRAALPRILNEVGIEPDEMQFTDLAWAAKQWMETVPET